MNVYFYCESENKKYVLLLTLKRFSHPHNAERIRDIIQSVIEEYKIPYNKIFYSITDNGSYMVKAFKIDWLLNSEDSENTNENELILTDSCNEIFYQIFEVIESDSEEFDNCEIDLNLHLENNEIKRLACHVHVLQRVINFVKKVHHSRTLSKKQSN